MHILHYEDQELDIWSELNHPNIVRFYGAIRHGEKIYMFAEFIDGETCFYLCEVFLFYIYVTVHEKTRYKSKIAILDDAHLKVQTLCYFMLESDWRNGDEITSV